MDYINWFHWGTTCCGQWAKKDTAQKLGQTKFFPSIPVTASKMDGYLSIGTTPRAAGWLENGAVDTPRR